MKTITLNEREEMAVIDGLHAMPTECSNTDPECVVCATAKALIKRIQSTPPDRLPRTYSPRRWSRRTGFRTWLNMGKGK